MPTPQLDRWTAVADAIGEWHRQDPGTEDLADIEERYIGFLDPVQRQIASSLFATYRRVMPKRDNEIVEVEQTYSTVWSTDDNATLGAAVQWSITSESGTEYVKLKTGRSRTSDPEVAVLIEGTDDEEASFIEVNTAMGTVETLELPEQERTRLIADLFAIAAAKPERRGTNRAFIATGAPDLPAADSIRPSNLDS